MSPGGQRLESQKDVVEAQRVDIVVGDVGVKGFWLIALGEEMEEALEEANMGL